MTNPIFALFIPPLNFFLWMQAPVGGGELSEILKWTGGFGTTGLLVYAVVVLFRTLRFTEEQKMQMFKDAMEVKVLLAEQTKILYQIKDRLCSGSGDKC